MYAPNEGVSTLAAEPSIIITMANTDGQLKGIERKVEVLHGCLFGAEPSDDGCESIPEPNVKSLAQSTNRSAERIERMLNEIYHRLAE